MFTVILISFLAGILTVLAPCVLPLLPVILGGGLAGTDKKRPYIIIISLIVSLILFTVLLKATTLLIDIHPKFWDYFSGGILILFGITLLFPKVWSWFVIITGIEERSQKSLQNAAEKEGIWGPIGIGAALGPVFSSCNPTYSLLLATVLPLDIIYGLIGLTAYFIGLGLILLLVTLFGRKILGKFTFFANPNGSFRKILGITILIVGIFVTFGTIKKLQTWVVENGNFSFIGKIEEQLNDQIDTQSLEKDTMMCSGVNCQPKNKTESGVLIDQAVAPEIVGITEWINLPTGQVGSELPTLESLRGKVILIDFWTYSCINCIRTQPYLNSWHEQYADDGLVILGLHAPEFAFEKLRKNVEKAIKDADIKYSVGLDNDFATWNAYDNRYWPAKYLIDQNGNIVYKHFGEGEYEATEAKIIELLRVNDKKSSIVTPAKAGVYQGSGMDSLLRGNDGEIQKKTPETYLGSARAKNMVFESGKYENGPLTLLPGILSRSGQWTLYGQWFLTDEYIESTLGDDKKNALALRFSAEKSFLVVSLAPGVKSGIIIADIVDDISGKSMTKTVKIDHDDLYTVFDRSEVKKEGQEIIYEKSDMGDEKATNIILKTSPGIRLHAFTFGD